MVSGFHDYGFAPSLQDLNQQHGNQERHFAFFFAAGYQLDPVAATLGLIAHENTTDPTNPDYALGGLAIQLGDLFKGGLDTGQVSQMIWKTICGENNPIKLP